MPHATRHTRQHRTIGSSQPIRSSTGFVCCRCRLAAPSPHVLSQACPVPAVIAQAQTLSEPTYGKGVLNHPDFVSLTVHVLRVLLC